MASNRFRLQYKFWLDMNKPDEHELAEVIDQLKQDRTYTRVVRDGIRLMLDLWQGRVELLLTLFPWVEDHFYQRFQEQQTADTQALNDQLQRLEKLLISQGNQPITHSSSGGSSALRPVQSAQPTAGNDDDVALLKATLRKDTSTDSAQNFINSMMNLQAGFKQ